ncbi:MAG: copper chaperone PCu(A)C [Steroidobacteraceae bacterium]
MIVQRTLLAAGLLVIGATAAALSQPPESSPSALHATARAASPSAAQVQVENAWIPQPPPGAEVAAAYFTLHNTGREPAALVGIDCPLAAAAMLHRTSVVAGESRMRRVQRLTIPPGRSVTLEPGALHVMLHRLARALRVGERVPLVLHFAGGKELRIEAKVRPLGSR